MDEDDREDEGVGSEWITKRALEQTTRFDLEANLTVLPTHFRQKELVWRQAFGSVRPAPNARDNDGDRLARSPSRQRQGTTRPVRPRW